MGERKGKGEHDSEYEAGDGENGNQRVVAEGTRSVDAGTDAAGFAGST